MIIFALCSAAFWPCPILISDALGCKIKVRENELSIQWMNKSARLSKRGAGGLPFLWVAVMTQPWRSDLSNSQRSLKVKLIILLLYVNRSCAQCNTKGKSAQYYDYFAVGCFIGPSPIMLCVLSISAQAAFVWMGLLLCHACCFSGGTNGCASHRKKFYTEEKASVISISHWVPPDLQLASCNFHEFKRKNSSSG